MASSTHMGAQSNKRKDFFDGTLVFEQKNKNLI
jgi:hypothetical protein